MQKPKASACLCRHAHPAPHRLCLSCWLSVAGISLQGNGAQAAGILHTEALLVMSAKKPLQHAKRPALKPWSASYNAAAQQR